MENNAESVEGEEKLAKPDNSLKRGSSSYIPNERLLRLKKLQNKLTVHELVEAPAVKGECITENATNASDSPKVATKVDILPPPSYDSVMKTPDCPNDVSSVPSSSQLPRYRDVAGLSDAPPSYHSLFTDSILRAINPFSNREDEEDNATNDHIVQNYKVTTLLLNMVLFIFMATFVLLLPIAMVVVGVIYIHECPVQPRIPIYLIVLGFFQMLECCGRLGYKIFQTQNSQQRNSWRERYRRKDPLVYFVIVWFVIGSMWVYQTDPDCKDCVVKAIALNYNLTNFNSTTTTALPLTTLSKRAKHKSVSYCNNIVYSFAFWVITTYYVIIGFFCILILIDVATRAVSRCCCSRRSTFL